MKRPGPARSTELRTSFSSLGANARTRDGNMISRPYFQARSIAAAVALSMTVAGGDALAQRGGPRRETSVEALLRRADAAREATDYSTALTLYQQAYTEGHQPEVLFNIGRMHLELRRWQEARAALRSFLENVPDAPNRTMTEQMIANAERELAAASAANGSDEQRRALEAQRAREEEERRRREQELRDRPPQARPAPTWPWVVLGAGGALAAGAAVTGVFTATSEAALFAPNNCVRTAAGIDCPSSARSTVEQARLFGGLTLGLGIGAGLLLAGGVGAVIATRPARAEASVAVRTATVVPHASGDGASVLLGGTL